MSGGAEAWALSKTVGFDRMHSELVYQSANAYSPPSSFRPSYSAYSSWLRSTPLNVRT